MPTRLRTAIAAILFTASPGAFAINLVYNADFDIDLSGWTTSGSAYRDFSFGSPDTGTLRLDALSNGATAVAGQCVDIHKWLTIDFALRYLVNVSGGFHQFKLDIYDAPGCTGTTLDTLYPNEGSAVAMAGTPDPGWLEAGDYGVALKPGSMSARVDLSTAGTSGGNAGYMVDHVQVGPLEVIFVDGFDAD
jgi:hypothetical protein